MIQEVIRREWMFKLVGDEKFTLGGQKAVCELKVDPMPHFTFSYGLVVDGKPYEKFFEKQNKELRTWAILIHNKRFKIVFGASRVLFTIKIFFLFDCH